MNIVHRLTLPPCPTKEYAENHPTDRSTKRTKHPWNGQSSHGQEMQPSKVLSQSHCSWKAAKRCWSVLDPGVKVFEESAINWKRSPLLKHCHNLAISIFPWNCPATPISGIPDPHFLKRRVSGQDMPSFPRRLRWSSHCGRLQWNPPVPLPAPRTCPGRLLSCRKSRAETPRPAVVDVKCTYLDNS